MKCDCGVTLSEETTKHYRALPATRTDPPEPEFWECECGAIYGWEYEQAILWPEEEEEQKELPILVTLPVVDTRERDRALPVEPETRGRKKLFKTTERERSNVKDSLNPRPIGEQYETLQRKLEGLSVEKRIELLLSALRHELHREEER